jgi:hypothetical protein
VDYRLVRWVGDPPVWSDPTIGKGLATQSLSLATADKLRFFNKWQRQFPVPGHSTRIIGPESGYSHATIGRTGGARCRATTTTWRAAMAQ